MERFTASADVQAPCTNPVLLVATVAAAETIGSYYLGQIVPTSLFAAETLLEFDLVSWKI